MFITMNAQPDLVCADAFNSRWMESKHKSDYGKFVLSAGKFYGDAEKDKGVCGGGEAHSDVELVL